MNYEQISQKQRAYLTGHKIKSVTTKIGFRGISNYLKNRISTLIESLRNKLVYSHSIFQTMLESRGLLITSIDHYYHQIKDPK